ncbi:hypothetical protein H9Q13_16725 [Pontibacter sp. JH31]|uniref:HNH endonuclease n=1 Tax=Pontibacter aquaedesilientis TaxID=2766980 RepID=A0ABR7XMD3_9BACT|nr:hypothetical protein [Pontibacter aquaedesilientis]MBD1398818.1 hypothetical protein [Pontibacter aquaedesilientis]
MRTLNFYDEDAFDFYEDVIKSKRNSKDDPHYKQRVSSHNETIKLLYSNYDRNFGRNSLQLLSKHGFAGSDKEDLHRLYSYKAKKFQSLKIKLTTTESNKKLSTCQNCTIGEVNSFDHFVPQEEFAEFVVNPKNLFPSCTKCNGYKSTAWRNGNKKLFLNLYLDSLPEEQYLFVNIINGNGSIETEFYLANTNGIDQELYELIHNHYIKLHLCPRFSENADTVITELENSIKNIAKKLPKNEVIETIVETASDNKVAFGHNYWKSVLEIALVRDATFMNTFEWSN